MMVVAVTMIKAVRWQIYFEGTARGNCLGVGYEIKRVLEIS